MSERYSKLYSLPGNLYAEGAPVVISAGALLKDNQTGRVLAQLKIKNIDPRVIKSVTVNVTLLDAANKPLGRTIEYQYLDFSAHRDEEFGQKTPISLPDATTRAFCVSVTRVIFSDNSEWNASDNPSIWTVIPAPAGLDRMLRDGELVKEYKLKYGESCQNAPAAYKDLWICSCGHINHENEGGCHRCRNTLAGLMAVDLAELNNRKNARLEQEAIRAAKLAEEAAKEAKRRKIIAAIAIPICVAIFVGIWYVATIPDRVIAKAEELANQGEYLEAVKLLDDLNDPERTAEIREEYTDIMEDQIDNAIYRKDYAGALGLIKKYTVLNTSEINLRYLQSKCGHSYVVTETVDNTCTDDGYIDRKCSVCEHEKREVLKAKGHSNSTKTVKAATCTETGLKVTECRTCGNVTETSIAKIAHSYQESVQKKPTCTETGVKLTQCTVCGETNETSIATVAHSYKDTVQKKPTCTATGIKVTKCTVCGKSSETSIAKIAHAYKEKVVKDATCTEKGSKQTECTMCGEKKSSASIDALGHSYNRSVKKSAGCTTDGVALMKCSRCQHSYEEPISATGHSWKNATCTTPKTCTGCKQTVGEALGHTTGTAKCGRCGVITFKTLRYSGTETANVCLDDKFVESFSLPSGRFKFTATYKCNADLYYPWAHIWILGDDGRPINTTSWCFSLKSGETFSAFCDGPESYCGIYLNGVYIGSWTLTIEAIG